MYNNFMLKLTFSKDEMQQYIHSKGLSTQILYTAELIIHGSLLLQHDLVYWPSTGYFAFIVSTAVVRYALVKVQLVNLQVQHKLVDCI
jgi:hypothetical protein